MSSISKRAVIYDNVSLGSGAVIEDFVVIGKPMSIDKVIIGKNAIIRTGSIIYPGVRIGDNFRTGVRATIREKTVIGDACLVGSNSILDGNCVLGDKVSIQSGAYITWGSWIGNDIFIAPCVVTTNDKYPPGGAEANLEGPVIKDGVTVGASAILLPGVVLNERCVVGSGSVVTKDVPKDEVWLGNPARFYKKRSDVYLR